METAGVHSQVAKVMPPLTIDAAVLETGLDIIEKSVAHVTKQSIKSAA